MAIIGQYISVIKDDVIGSGSKTKSNNSSYSNYTVDLSKLTANSNCAANFYCPAYGHSVVPVNKILWSYSSSPTSQITYFRDSISGHTYYFKGTVVENKDAWHLISPVHDYFITPSSLNQPQFIARGSYPQFSQTLYSTLQGTYGTYTLKIVNNELVLTKPDNSSTTFSATYFKDQIIPDRLLVVLQGAGGGGGGNSGGQYFIVTLIGSDGGGGGSGALLCIVINTSKLKESSSNYFKIVTGQGGGGGHPYEDGMVSEQGAGWVSWYGGDGSKGANSSIYFNNTLLISAGGGYGATGGGTPGAVNFGKGGSGGSVTKGKDPGDYYWIVSQLSGLTGANPKSNGPASSTNTIYCVSNSKKTQGVNKLSVGGKSGGSHATNSAGGAASYLGPGGNGGSDGSSCQGKAPSEGFGGGGGGARYYVGGACDGGNGAQGYMAIYY